MEAGREFHHSHHTASRRGEEKRLVSGLSSTKPRAKHVTRRFWRNKSVPLIRRDICFSEECLFFLVLGNNFHQQIFRPMQSCVTPTHSISVLSVFLIIYAPVLAGAHLLFCQERSKHLLLENRLMIPMATVMNSSIFPWCETARL